MFNRRARRASISDDDEASHSSSFTAGIDALAHFFREKLHVGRVTQILNDTTVDALVDYIKSGRCKNILTMVGAGISTAAGIPDFRSPESGLYDNLKKYKLPCPEAIFTLDYFQENPKPFFCLARELIPETLRPTLSHYFIKLLHDKGLLLRHYTQNIDGLERISGIPNNKVVEAHGTFSTGHCLKCRKEYTLEWMKVQIFKTDVPKCTNCQGVVKPDIVFFGEPLSTRFFKCVRQDFKKCDLLIVMGSSLVVQPFASLVSRVKRSCPRLLINREMAESLSYRCFKNYRDVAMLGNCDEQCKILATKLGWRDELESLMYEEHRKLDVAEGARQSNLSNEDEKKMSEAV